MKTKPKNNSIYRRSLPIVAISLLAIYFLLPQLPSFRTSLRSILNADVSYILIAIIFFIGTYFAAAACYCLIAYYKLRFWPTLLIQVADGFTNRLAPAGLGAVATNVLYLIKQSKSGALAGYVAGLNNLIGFVAHFLLLVLLLFISQQSPRGIFNFKLPHLDLWLVLISTLIIACLIYFWRRLRRVSAKSYSSIAKIISTSLKRPAGLIAGLFAAMLITICYGLTLYAVMLALNVHISFLQAFLVLTVSVIAMTITPTPGGLGGVEAGMVATMVSFGVASGPALSVTLVYRFITYWLPILPGVVALRLASSRGYIGKT